jgi:hypothetical protein
VPDLAFIARAAAMLLTSRGGAQRAWAARDRLAALVLHGLGGDAPAAALVAGSSPLALAQVIARAARADPAFAAALRQLVVQAYAEPELARDLPDPAPRLD